MLSLLCLCLVAIAYGKPYEGYKVLRIPFSSPSAKDFVLDLASNVSADVWTVNSAYADVMVSPQQFPHFSSLGIVYVPDVQAMVDEAELENQAAMDKAGDNLQWDFNYFPRIAPVNTFLVQQAALHAGVAKGITLGRTHLGASINGLAFGAADRPVFYIHCGIHAREWISVTSCLWIIDQLLNVDPERTSLLNSFYWIVVPVHNIDGYEFSHTSTRLWRKNRQPNTGSTCIGTDVNRNYGFQWGGGGASTDPCSETFRGASAWSSPEARDEEAFLRTYTTPRRLAAYVDIHSYGAYFLSAWGYSLTLTPPAYPTMNTNMVASVAAIRAVNGRSYSYGASGKVLYQTSGSTVDQYYGQHGVTNSYTIECAGSNFTPPTTDIQPIAREVWAGVKQLAKNALLSQQ